MALPVLGDDICDRTQNISNLCWMHNGRRAHPHGMLKCMHLLCYDVLLHNNCFPCIAGFFKAAPRFVAPSHRKPAFIETIHDTCGASGRRQNERIVILRNGTVWRLIQLKNRVVSVLETNGAVLRVLSNYVNGSKITSWITSPNFARTEIMNKFKEELVKGFSPEIVLCEDVFYEI